MTEFRHKWWIFCGVCLLVFLINLDGTIVNLALASIASYFHIDLNATQWVAASYLLVTSVTFALFGRLADSWGHKTMFLLGIVCFTLGSLAAVLAPTFNLLIIARMLQGLGFATLGLCFVIIIRNFPAHQRGLAIGLSVTITGLGQALGPTLGGILVHYFSWHSVFLINVPLGIISLVMTMIFVPADTDKKPLHISWLNVALFMLGLSLLLYTLNQISELPWWLAVAGIMLSLLLLSVFLRLSFQQTNPLIDVSLLRNRHYRALMSLRFVFMMISMGGAYFLLPLYMQNILGYSAEKTGYYLLAMTALVAVASPLTGRIIDKTGFTKPIFCSIAFIFFACIAMVFFHIPLALPLLFSGLVFMGLAVGIHLPATVSAVNSLIEESKAGTANGLFFTAAISGATVGIALTGNLIHMVSQHYLATHLKLAVNSATLDLMHNVATGTASASLLTPNLASLAKHAFLSGFQTVMALFCVLLLFALGLALRLHKEVK